MTEAICNGCRRDDLHCTCEENCPDHRKGLQYAEDQGDEFEFREHLECTVAGCEYEVWA